MHKPTFFPAVGGRNEGGNLQSVPTQHVSARNLPSQTRLKRRRPVRLLEEELVENQELLESIKNNEDLEALFPKENKAHPDDQDIDECKSEQNSQESECESSEDEDADLARELEAIRLERELKAAAEVKTEREKQLQSITQSIRDDRTSLNKHWTEDTVFNVQHKNTEPERYTNDTVMSTFHKRFLERYIK